MAHELNPNHPVVIETREQWYKLCAILLFKSGSVRAEITTEDIDRFTKSGLANIVVHPKGDVITLSLVSDSEAMRLARKEGGLPI
jgi:hypothetical protein